MSAESSSSGGISDSFHRALGYVEEHVAEISTPDLFYLYARYKQVILGPCQAPPPSMFSFKKRTKWQVWMSLGEMTREEAMQQYVEKLSLLLPEWNGEVDASPAKKPIAPKKPIGPVFSTFMKTEPEIRDESKTAFDWVKEGNVEQLKKFLRRNKALITARDEQGLSLMHWASDRGYIEIVTLLMSYGVNIDCQDEDGQTALHYASSCGHGDLVKYLLNNGASANMPDSEGHMPKDVALSPAIKKLFHTTV